MSDIYVRSGPRSARATFHEKFPGYEEFIAKYGKRPEQIDDRQEWDAFFMKRFGLPVPREELVYTESPKSAVTRVRRFHTIPRNKLSTLRRGEMLEKLPTYIPEKKYLERRRRGVDPVGYDYEERTVTVLGKRKRGSFRKSKAKKSKAKKKTKK